MIIEAIEIVYSGLTYFETDRTYFDTTHQHSIYIPDITMKLIEDSEVISHISSISSFDKFGYFNINPELKNYLSNILDCTTVGGTFAQGRTVDRSLYKVISIKIIKSV